MPLNLTETSSRATCLEGIYEGARVYLSQYDNGRWFWQVTLGAVQLGGIVASREFAEAIVVKAAGIARCADADVRDAVKEVTQPDDNGDCPTCAGTGEGHADRERCWRCKGAGMVLP